MKRVIRRLIPWLAVVVFAACGGSKGTPTNPTPTPTTTPTRIIRLEGTMAFGNIQVGTTFDATLRIYNEGNAVMTVTNITIAGATGSTGYQTNWSNGTIAAGTSQAATIRFSPVAEQAYNGTLTVVADHTSGTNTIAISGTGARPPGPRTQFGAGQWLVNTDIAAGRYYDVPSNGCYWERLSGLGGTLGDIIANEFIGAGVGQWIVDILSTDRAFKTDAECGIWFSTPRRGSQATIVTGTWLVGSQVTPGTYRTTAQAGCYWERLRNFTGNISGVIANDFVSSAGQVLVTISAGDTGFSADPQCGTWSPAFTLQPEAERWQTPRDIESNRDRARDVRRRR